jgi:hypothetical protein
MSASPSLDWRRCFAADRAGAGRRRRLIRVGDLGERAQSGLERLARLQLERAVPTATHEEQLIRQHVADRPQLAGEVMALAQETCQREVPPVSELGHDDRNQPPITELLDDRPRLGVTGNPHAPATGARVQRAPISLSPRGRDQHRERVEVRQRIFVGQPLPVIDDDLRRARSADADDPARAGVQLRRFRRGHKVVP